jgi:uncharacterized protein with FMN-binding domain
MRGAHVAVIVGGTAVIVAAGFAAAPPLHPPTAAPEPEPSGEPGPSSTASPGGASGGQAFDGPPVTNARGTYQAQIIVVDGVVTDVVALEAGTSAPESVSVNGFAIPELKQKVLEAQSWDVEAVSGASYTSPAFTESLQGAFEAAGLS